MCASGAAAHAASTWGGSGLLSPALPVIFFFPYGTYLFPGILPFTCAGCDGRHGERVELSGKVAPSTVFVVEEKVKAGLSRELSRAVSHWLVGTPRSRKGCKECPVGSPGIGVLASSPSPRRQSSILCHLTRYPGHSAPRHLGNCVSLELHLSSC